MYYDKELISNAKKIVNIPVEGQPTPTRHDTRITGQFKVDEKFPTSTRENEKNKSLGTSRKFLGFLKDLFRSSEEEMARFREYQEQKEMWVKELEDSAPKHMKARIRAGGWI